MIHHMSTPVDMWWKTCSDTHCEYAENMVELSAAGGDPFDDLPHCLVGLLCADENAPEKENYINPSNRQLQLVNT